MGPSIKKMVPMTKKYYWSKEKRIYTMDIYKRYFNIIIYCMNKYKNKSSMVVYVTQNIQKHNTIKH